MPPRPKNRTIKPEAVASGIYKITNLISNKIYIGSAANIKRRFATHQSQLRSNTHGNKYLQRSFNKYGIENFKFEIIELVEDKTKLIEREQFYIDFTNCNNKNIGYNINPNAASQLGLKHSKERRLKNSLGHLGFKHSVEAKKKMSITRKGRPGKKHTEETKIKMSLSGKKKIFTQKHKDNLSLARRNIIISEENKKKLKIAMWNRPGRWPHELGRKCKCDECKIRMSKHRSYYYFKTKSLKDVTTV